MGGEEDEPQTDQQRQREEAESHRSVDYQQADYQANGGRGCPIYVHSADAFR